MAEYRSVLFICTGNYYRSRLSEILFNHYARIHQLDWDADSRGLVEKVRYEGLSPSARKYLERKKMEGLDQYERNPQALMMRDLERSKLVIALNREEHEPMMKMKFGQVPSVMEKQGRLRYWNVYDVPAHSGFLQGLFRSNNDRSYQKEESGTEHIDFAVQSLVAELARSGK